MKYVAYILTAVLGAASAVMLALAGGAASRGADTLAPGFTLNMWMLVALMAGLTALAVVQLFRSTPRVMLIFAGASAGMSVTLLLAGGLFGLAMLAAGLIPALYELIRHGRAVKAQPKRRVKPGLLIASGVLACVDVTYALGTAASSAALYASMNLSAAAVFMTSSAGILFGLAFAVFCFMITRRTGALYRLFFAGLPAFGLLLLPFTVSAELAAGLPAAMAVAAVIIAVVRLLAVLFVFIHAAKHRREDFAPRYEPPSEPAEAAAA